MSETEGPDAPRRPWLWIGLSAVLLVGVVALAVWAVGLRQDLDDSNAEVERYQAQSEQVATESDDLSAQIDQLAAAIDDTSGRLDEAIAAGQQSADELRGKAADANQGAPTRSARRRRTPRQMRRAPSRRSTPACRSSPSRSRPSSPS
jgi:septal ring factor EnvC (AmiA/AmiB activator)